MAYPVEVQKAYQAALEAREKAYAPYSKYHVGAAVKWHGREKVFSGCNVENSSYGATVCAERIAIFNSITEQGAGQIEFFVLVTENLAGPCGMCLQVMSEFADGKMPVYLGDLEGLQKKCAFEEFLPTAFDKEMLPAFQNK